MAQKLFIVVEGRMRGLKMMTYYTFINVANDVIFSFLVTQANVSAYSL